MTFNHSSIAWIKGQLFISNVSDDSTAASIKEIAVLVMILGVISVLALQKQPLSSLLSSSPYKGCDVDSDCILQVTTCHACSCGEAVNKNWKPFCPVKSAANQCKPCTSEGSEFEIKCIRNLCQKVLK